MVVKAFLEFYEPLLIIVVFISFFVIVFILYSHLKCNTFSRETIMRKRLLG